MRTVLITGAGSGIGQAVALEFLKDNNFQVILSGRNKENLEQTKNLTGQNSKNAYIFPADVSKPEAVQNLFSYIKDNFKTLDILFNNAGRFGPSVPIDEISILEWQEIVDVNLNGMFYCARESFILMKQNGGRIINNGSLSSKTPRPNSVSYTTTKHAISGLTKSINLDGRKHNIVASQVDIGNAATALTAKMAQGILQADGSIKPEPRMDVTYTAQLIVQIAKLPLDVNIPFMDILASKMPSFIGRG